MTFPETSQEERKAKPKKPPKTGTIGHTREGDNTCNLMKQQQHKKKTKPAIKG